MKGLVNWPGHAFLAVMARMFLGIVFIYACVHKIAHPDVFALDIATYDILPLALVNLMAIILPWVELGAGLALLAGFRVRGAALATAGMMVMFIVAVVLAMAKGLDMSCGCFASQAAAEDDPISGRTILLDSVWLALSVYVFLFDRNAIGFDRWLAGRRKKA